MQLVDKTNNLECETLGKLMNLNWTWTRCFSNDPTFNLRPEFWKCLLSSHHHLSFLFAFCSRQDAKGATISWDIAGIVFLVWLSLWDFQSNCVDLRGSDKFWIRTKLLGVHPDSRLCLFITKWNPEKNRWVGMQSLGPICHNILIKLSLFTRALNHV